MVRNKHPGSCAHCHCGDATRRVLLLPRRRCPVFDIEPLQQQFAPVLSLRNLGAEIGSPLLCRDFNGMAGCSCFCGSESAEAIGVRLFRPWRHQPLEELFNGRCDRPVLRGNRSTASLLPAFGALLRAPDLIPGSECLRSAPGGQISNRGSRIPADSTVS